MLYVLLIIGGIVIFITFLLILKNPIRGLYLITFFLPILFNPLYASRSEFLTGSHYVAIVDFIVLATFVSWLIQIITKKRKIILFHNEIYIILGLFLIAILISFFAAHSFKNSFLEFIIFLYLSVFLFLVTQLITNEVVLKKTIKIWVISYICVVLFGLAQIVALKFGVRQYIFWRLPYEKISSSFLVPAQLVSYLVILFMLFLLPLLKTKNIMKNFFSFGFVLLICLVLISTGARIAVLLLFFLFVSFFIWKIKYFGTWRLYGLIILIAILLFTIPTLILRLPTAWPIYRAVTFFDNTDVISVNNISLKIGSSLLESMDPVRYLSILGWLKTIQESPLVGIGAGNFPNRFPEYFCNKGAIWTTMNPDLHNTYLSIWAETGILGFLFLVLFIVAVFKKCVVISRIRNYYWRQIGVVLSIGFLSNLIYGLFHLGLRQRHFWFLIAVIVSLNYVIRQRTNTDKHRYEHR